MPSYDPADILNDTLPFWDSADVRVANLESQCTTRTQPAIPAKGMRAPAEAAEFVRAARIDAVTVANNHALDFGSGALEESRRRVIDLGVGVTGFLGEGECCQQAYLVERNGLRIGMLSWCDTYRPPETEPITARPAVLPDENAILSAVRALCADTDIVVVQLHWGFEFALHPLLRHRNLARRIADAGADIVLCHHAHVPMAVELRGRSVIAHGLGNWIFADRPYFRNNPDWTVRSFLLKVGVGAQGVHWAEVEPFQLGPDSRIQRITGAERTRFLAHLARLNRRLLDDDWLRRAQTARMLYEAVTITRYLGGATPAQVYEKARILALPSGAGLIADLREMQWESARRLGDWLHSLVAAAGDPPQVLEAWSSGAESARRNAADLAKRYQWTAAFRARIP